MCEQKPWIPVDDHRETNLQCPKMKTKVMMEAQAEISSRCPVYPCPKQRKIEDIKASSFVSIEDNRTALCAGPPNGMRDEKKHKKERHRRD
ncbi:hypothetical protein Y1Q_0016521 [Alligator mississippiensis]|uniref:Uncharacterized protein n=1 Tax=Alligator mississippiensis TaxID=8496 RepID=A0A151N2Y5_ALLMI|nr:hypothetical protein Y1Q_0016521 [Alligator mississippiensis]